MKKLLSLNVGTKGFRQEYDEACTALEIDTTVIRSQNCCLILKDGKVSLLHKNITLIPEEYGYVFIRVTGRYALMTSLLTQFFQHLQIPISDDAYLQHTRNEEKITQMLLFTLAGVPIPASILFTIKGFLANKETIIKNTTFPCVLKTNGSQGRNVWKIENQVHLEKQIADLKLSDEVAMIQEYIPNSYDIRAIFMHGEIIGAIKRMSANGFLNNVSAGGAVEQIILEKDETELAIKASETLGRSFAGVDIVRTINGPLIFEVNLGPQIYGFESATNINVPSELLQRIRKYFLA